MRISLWLAMSGMAALGEAAAGAAPPVQAQVLQLFSYELTDKAQFEQGYRRHLGWHAAHGDKLVWYGWMVDSGGRKGLFVDGTAGASYPALDARPDPAGDGLDATRNFLPFVHAVNVETWELWPAVSTATPLEERAPGAVMDVYMLRVSPDAAGRFERALARLAARRGADIPPLTWYRAVRGRTLPAYLLVLSRSDWADVGRAGGTLDLLLARAYAASPDDIEKVLGALAAIEVESWSYQPRLSLIPGKPLAPDP
jgi:hypothetical protein